MRYLLDTNILIYYISDKSSLSQNVLSVLEDYDSVLCISTETLSDNKFLFYTNQGLELIFNKK